MKFGKNLLREMLQSNPEWAPFWLNYKSLKKRIKQVKQEQHEGEICEWILLFLCMRL